MYDSKFVEKQRCRSFAGNLFVIFVLIAMSGTVFADPDPSAIELKVIRGVAEQEQNIEYFHRILAEALALNKGGDVYKLKRVDFEYPQNRTLRLLNDVDVLDITYSMTSAAREEEYIAIKVPLLNGLYGKRRLFIAAENQEKFASLTLKQLKRLVACQGMHWPDFERLKRNGFAAYGVNDYEANFKMLAKGRCDYFPRGLAEIEWEMELYNGKYGELVAVDSIMLLYDAPVYFFTGKHNKALAEVVEQGLIKLRDQGRLNDILETTEAFVYDRNFERSPSLKVYRLD